MRPGNMATLNQLREAIGKNGFTMKQSTAMIAGKVLVTNGKAVLQVSGSGEILELIPEPSATPLMTSFDGKSVLVDGTIPEAGKGKLAGSIRYRSMKEDDSK